MTKINFDALLVAPCNPRNAAPVLLGNLNDPDDWPYLLTLEEVGHILRCHPRAIWNLTEAGDLDYVVRGSGSRPKRLVRSASLRAYVSRPADLSTKTTKARFTGSRDGSRKERLADRLRKAA